MNNTLNDRMATDRHRNLNRVLTSNDPHTRGIARDFDNLLCTITRAAELMKLNVGSDHNLLCLVDSVRHREKHVGIQVHHLRAIQAAQDGVEMSIISRTLSHDYARKTTDSQPRDLSLPCSGGK